MTLSQFFPDDKVNETKSQLAAAIPVSLSYSFLNKIPLKDNAFTSFRPAHDMSLNLLIQHILSGRAFMPAMHSAFRRTKESFERARLLVLDFDNDENGSLPVSVPQLRNHPFVGRFAAFIYATPSSTEARPKSRALFVLDRLITDAQEYENAAAALIHVCNDLQPDKACKDAARLFYGSNDAEHDTDAQAVLKLQLLDELAEIESVRTCTKTEKQARPQAVISSVIMNMQSNLSPLAERRRRRYIESAFEKNITAISHASGGTRNNTLYKKTCECLRLSLSAPDLLSNYDVLAQAERAGLNAGLSESEVKATIESAARAILQPATLPVFETPLRIIWPAQAEPLHEPEYEPDPDHVSEDDHLDEKRPRYASLPDSIRYLIASFDKGAAAALNALYAAQSHGSLSAAFDLQDVMSAFAQMHYDASEKSLYRTLSWLRKAELIQDEKQPAQPENEFFQQTPHTDNTHNVGLNTCGVCENNSPRGRRRRKMSLMPISDLMPKLKHFVAIQTLDSLYPDAPARVIDPLSIDPYYFPILARVFESLSRRRVTALKLLIIQDALIDSEKHLAAALLDMIYSLPAQVTAQTFIDTLDMSRESAKAAAERLNALQNLPAPIIRMIEAKAALMSRIYRARIESLDNLHSTALNLELDGQSFIDLLRHESAAALSGQAVSGRKMAEIMGMHDRRSAYRVAARVGIERHERRETVIIAEPERAAVRAAERSAKGKCLRVLALDQSGSLIAAAAAHEIESLPKGAARYEAYIQKASLMLVGQLPARTEARPQRAAAPAQDVSPEMDTMRAAPAPVRIPRKRLYTQEFLLSRVLAPRVQQYDGFWVNPETGELFEDASGLINSLIERAAQTA